MSSSKRCTENLTSDETDSPEFQGRSDRSGTQPRSRPLLIQISASLVSAGTEARRGRLVFSFPFSVFRRQGQGPGKGVVGCWLLVEDDDGLRLDGLRFMRAARSSVGGRSVGRC